MLFESSRYTIQSRHHNLIGFAIDVALFVRVLRSAASHDAAHSLEVKLTTKDVPAGAGSTETVNKPFLCFMAKVSPRGGGGAGLAALR